MVVIESSSFVCCPVERRRRPVSFYLCFWCPYNSDGGDATRIVVWTRPYPFPLSSLVVAYGANQRRRTGFPFLMLCVCGIWRMVPLIIPVLLKRDVGRGSVIKVSSCTSRTYDVHRTAAMIKSQTYNISVLQHSVACLLEVLDSCTVSALVADERMYVVRRTTSLRLQNRWFL